VPWSTVSFGLAATVALKSGTIMFITAGCARTVAGEGRVAGVSGLGAFKERSASRRLALASRWVRGLTPKEVSIVAGICASVTESMSLASMLRRSSC